MRRRAADEDPDASWLFLVFLLKGQRPVMVASALGLYAATARCGLGYIGQGLAARRPIRSSRRRALMAGTDDHTLSINAR
jgi:hypothetical protein